VTDDEDEDAKAVRLLDVLPLELAVIAAGRMAPRRACEKWRLDRRDETIRAATAFLPDMRDDPRARRISQDLTRCLALATLRTAAGDCCPSTYDGAIRRIAVLNGRESLTPRQILNVFNHSRGGSYRSKKARTFRNS